MNERAGAVDYEWWVEDDVLRLWVRHVCTDGRVDEWHPDSRWSITQDGPVPSFDCARCGAHRVLTTADRGEPS